MSCLVVMATEKMNKTDECETLNIFVVFTKIASCGKKQQQKKNAGYFGRQAAEPR